MGKIKFILLKGDFWSGRVVGVREKCGGHFEGTYTGENLMNMPLVKSV